MPKLEFIVGAGQVVRGGSKAYPAGSRIAVSATESTTQINGELLLSREAAAQLAEQGLGRLVGIPGALIYGSSVPVGWGGAR